MLLHSKILGKGEPLLIIHGFFGMGDNWKSLANKFSKNFEVHLIDQRNHGRSFHTDDFTYELMADDLHHYISHHQLKNVNLIGHSMGGKTAMQFACTYPEIVSKLIVADIAPKAYPLHHQDILKALSSLDFSELDSRKQADEVLSRYIKNMGIRQFLLKNLFWKEKGQLGLRINLPVLIKNIEEVGKALSENSVYSGDALFLRGANSQYIEVNDEMLILKHFPKAKIETISNAGHWLHAENPKDFYSEVINFVN